MHNCYQIAPRLKELSVEELVNYWIGTGRNYLTERSRFASVVNFGASRQVNVCSMLNIEVEAKTKLTVWI